MIVEDEDEDEKMIDEQCLHWIFKKLQVGLITHANILSFFYVLVCLILMFCFVFHQVMNSEFPPGKNALQFHRLGRLHVYDL